jgi:hypothetical protein
MILDLIEQAKTLLKKSNPSDDELLQVETRFRPIWKPWPHTALRSGGPGDVDEANRLLREIRRERGRRIASAAQPLSRRPPRNHQDPRQLNRQFQNRGQQA